MLCILAHLGLIVGGAIAYVYNKMSRDTTMVEWARLGGLNMGRAAPCSRDLQLVLESEMMATPATLDVALHTLPVWCLALVCIPSLFPLPERRISVQSEPDLETGMLTYVTPPPGSPRTGRQHHSLRRPFGCRDGRCQLN